MADEMRAPQVLATPIPLIIAKNLRPDEYPRTVTRQLPIPLAVHLAAMFGGLLAAIAVSQVPGTAAAVRPIAWLLWLFLTGRLVAAAASWPFYQVVISNKRVLVISGFFKQQVTPFPLPDPDEVGFTQNFRGRVWGYGTITLTPAGGTASSFDFLPVPQMLYLELLAAKDTAEE
jgi:Bacterial PH domain